MLYLAKLAGERAKATEVAVACDAPASSVQQVLQALTRARLVVSNSSASGGYELQVRPEQCSLLQIIEAVEGPIGGRCLLTSHPCPCTEVCPLHQAWSGAIGAFTERLSGTTLAEVLAGEGVLRIRGQRARPRLRRDGREPRRERSGDLEER